MGPSAAAVTPFRVHSTAAGGRCVARRVLAGLVTRPVAGSGSGVQVLLGRHDRRVTDGGVLEQLRAVAAQRRVARRVMADVYAEHGRSAPERPAAQAAYEQVCQQWSALIRTAAAVGHPVSEVARAAGCARPSLYRHLRAGENT